MKRNTVIDYAVIAIAAVVLAFLLQAFVVKPYRIPSPSMVPTLDVGDRVLVARFIYHFDKPSRGDIVVFRWPGDNKTVFIKRIIGVPGDTISLKDGRVYVNGQELDEPYVAKDNGQTQPTDPAPMMPGSTMSQPWSLNQSYTVPPDSYFVMGDNRTASDDSRVWGPVPTGNLIGQAFFTYWPPTRIGVP